MQICATKTPLYVVNKKAPFLDYANVCLYNEFNLKGGGENDQIYQLNRNADCWTQSHQAGPHDAVCAYHNS